MQASPSSYVHAATQLLLKWFTRGRKYALVVYLVEYFARFYFGISTRSSE